MKRRPPDKGIVLLLADAGPGPDDRRMGPAATALGAAFWPGGLTVVVPQRADVPSRPPHGRRPTIGLRVPDHATPRALAAAVGPLPTTSANRSGLPEGRDAEDIATQLGATSTSSSTAVRPTAGHRVDACGRHLHRRIAASDPGPAPGAIASGPASQPPSTGPVVAHRDPRLACTR